MQKRVDEDEFRDLFKGRAVIATDLPAGPARDLAYLVNEALGRGDASLRTDAEYSALFAGLLAESGAAAGEKKLSLLDDSDQPTAAGRAVTAYLAVAHGKDEFFAQPMYVVEITGWPRDDPRTDEPVESSGAARLALWRADPADARHVPPPGAEGVLFTTGTFSLVNSGNRTRHAPKRSWKVDFDVRDGEDRVVGMSKLNLKSMVNDPSQMREALAWNMFRAAGVPASQHTYARLAINGSYLGLFSLIEQVDKRFLADHFGKNRKGNLYKGYCGDLGCATLEHRAGPDGDNGGRQYISADRADQTYRLQSNEDDPTANTYDDLARFVRTVNGVGLGGGEDRFGSDGFRASIEGIMNVRAFLRWAGVNLLIGAWDNYFATPANYYLYNSGRKDGEDDFVDDPYFTFIPWDYDNTFGIDYVGTAWQYTDIVDWASNTEAYWGEPGKRSRIPLVQNLLRNHDFCQYYLDHLEHLLDTTFNVEAVSAVIAPDRADGLWGRISQSAYLESDTPYGQPFTGRQFSNDEVYLAGDKQNELRHGTAKIEGIVHYVRMRRDSARAQLAKVRATYPHGASGATFPGVLEKLPGSVSRAAREATPRSP